MNTTTRKTIIDQLKSDLETKITVANGYNSDVVEVRPSVCMWEDLQLKPALSFWAYEDEIEDHLMGGIKLRILKINVYSYTNTDGITDTNRIYDLVEDVENFLKSSDNTYRKETVMGKSVIYTGGVQDKAGIGRTEIHIKYKQS
jgi:hypothetical protein